MTALVDRLEQLHARYLSEQPGYRVETRTELEREMLGALPALLTALRAAHALLQLKPTEVPGAGGTLGRVDMTRELYALQQAITPLFGEDTTP